MQILRQNLRRILKSEPNFIKIFRKVSQTILLSNHWRLQVKKKAVDDVIRNIKIKSLWRPAFVCELVSQFVETQFRLVWNVAYTNGYLRFLNGLDISFVSVPGGVTFSTSWTYFNNIKRLIELFYLCSEGHNELSKKIN